jgi:hypothetical protein
MRVAHAVRPVVFRNLAKQQLPLRRPSCPRHSRRGIHDHHTRLVYQPTREQRCQTEQDPRRIAARVRDQLRPTHALPPQLRQPVHRTMPSIPQVGRQIYHPCAGLMRTQRPCFGFPGWQTREHHIHVAKRNILRPDIAQPAAVRPLPRFRLRGRKHGPQLGVARQHSEQFLSGVTGRAEHGGGGWFLIHHCSYKYTNARETARGYDGLRSGGVCPVRRGTARQVG